MEYRKTDIRQFTRADFDSRLRHLSTPQELATLLNEVLATFSDITSRPAQLRYFANTANIVRRSRTFYLHKKHGGYREIIAPRGNFRDILHALNIVFQAYGQPTPWAFGFVCGRSVVDNALPHVGKRYVLSLDLKDFFPSIRRQQIADCLSAEPFGFSPAAVQLVSGLVTARIGGEDALAQGFATSPILSNFVCREMDQEIAAVARRMGANYTRYADDLTLSADADVLRPGDELVQEVGAIVRRHGFTLNDRKTHLQRRGRRQAVTGLMVTEKVNVSRRYVREIRSLLYIWERYGYEDACQAAWKHYRQQHGKTKGHQHHVPLNAVLRGKLNYLRMVRGSDDALCQRLSSRYLALAERSKKDIRKVEANATCGKYVQASSTVGSRHTLSNTDSSAIRGHDRGASAPDSLASRYAKGSASNPYGAEDGRRKVIIRVLQILFWVAVILAWLYLRR
ncbi:MAG: reverse transcriptase family protein [Prevotella sp.]|nr:reverse transcriptase family protein [Prevotella sp.]